MRQLKWLSALGLVALLMSRPQAATLGASMAMANWYASVAPALFPFLALMPLLTCREAVQAYERLLGRAMKTLFDLPGGAAPAMFIGMVGGMPAGAIAARHIAARSSMNRGQLHRVASAFAGFSPAFLVGGVGAGMLGSAALGWKLWEAQLLTQLTLALLLRRAWRDRTQPVPELLEGGGDQPVRAAVLTVLTICGYMALFGALNVVAASYIGRRSANALLCLLDVPSGALWLSSQPMDEVWKLTLLAAMCGFGGMCVAMQSLSALKGCGMSAVEYTGLRALAGAISAGWMALLLRVSLRDASMLLVKLWENPYQTAALFASILAIPALFKIRKSIN